MKFSIPAAGVIIAMILSPVSAQADTRLEQFEAISEALGTMILRSISDQMRADLPLPDLSWDDDFRLAGACILDQWQNIGGPELVDVMLLETAAVAKAGFTSRTDLMQAQRRIAELTLPAQMQYQISEDCGMNALTEQRVRESGFQDAITAAARAQDI